MKIFSSIENYLEIVNFSKMRHGDDDNYKVIPRTALLRLKIRQMNFVKNTLLSAVAWLYDCFKIAL